MNTIMVRFPYENEFNEARLPQAAEGVPSKFQGMPGLQLRHLPLMQLGAKL